MTLPPTRETPTATPQDEAALRRALGEVRGPAFWERLDELAGTEAFRSYLRREYPGLASRLDGTGDGVGRRDFLRLMGATLAAAGLGACTRQPEEKIVPYARMPEAIVPGRPLWFATAMPLDGAALGLVVESHEGRPTKVEGNAQHPSSLGSTDVLAQAAILGLYDPDRSHGVLRLGQITTWDAFLTELAPRLERIEARGGEGLSVLSGEILSPTLAGQKRRLAEGLPAARWHQWTPLHRDAERRAARDVFGRGVATRYALDRAKVVVSLDADFLASGPGGVRYARDLATARRPDGGGMARLWAVEGAPSLTGANADHRLAVRPSQVEGVVRALARALDLPVDAPALGEAERRFALALAADLRSAGGAAALVPGRAQAPAVHALCHRIHAALGCFGSTVELTEPVAEATVDSAASLAALADDARAGRIEMLVILGGNPVYDAPAELELASAIEGVPFRVHLSSHDDETSSLCHWHVPEAHFLESWSDARAHDGTASVVQPLIAPLFGGRTAHELVAVLGGDDLRKPYDLVRRHWREGHWGGLADGAFEAEWRAALHDGVIEGTRFPPLELEPSDAPLGPAPRPAEGLEIALRGDPSVFDGRFANNGWLQELPRPLSRLTWENAAWISAATARELGVESGDVVELRRGERAVRAPVWVLPGHPEGSVTVHLGYGRRRAGALGTGRGFDAYRLRTGGAWNAAVEVRRTGDSASLACVQDHGRMEGRDIVRVGVFDRFRRDPRAVFPERHEPTRESMLDPYPYGGNAWGMVIDLNACIGCNACTIACQSENNVAVVGKEEVSLGREMHWIRVDRYWEEGPDGGTRALHQPVPCMHCEKAPCETVCPVGATVHSEEGLNEMVYNRCVGTRYCSNNCPYKVRRFNFHLYSDWKTDSLELARNPDVTVRSRGVMEKCTYCVQRINQARIAAKKEDRGIRDGEIVTACQQVCPTRAIVFGDVNDPESAVSRRRAEPRHYGLLEELGTRPRTTYLAKLDHPDPGLVSE